MLTLSGTPFGCAQRRATGLCARCEARPFSVCASLAADDLDRLDALAERLTLQPGETLFRDGDSAGHLFNVTSGSLRTYRLMADGRRHVTGFLFAGDFIGLTGEAVHRSCAEAMEPATVCRFRKTEWRALMDARRVLETALLARAARELTAAADHALLLARKTALERVASFLRDLPGSDRLRPETPGHVRLPMTRTEIADYLGVTLETVSRSLRRLKCQGVIRQLSLTEMVVEKPAALSAIADGEV